MKNTPVVKSVLVEKDDGLPIGKTDETTAFGPEFTNVEPHVLLSTLLLVCAVGCDALTSIDVPVGDVDSPSSLRVSSLVLALMVSSPVLRGVNLVDQRVLLGLLLALFSFVGLHQQDEETRTGDCIFIVVVLLGSIMIVYRGGIEAEHTRPDKQQDRPHRRQTVSALCAALTFYSGLRGIRASFVSSMVAKNYKVEYQTSSGNVLRAGYAFSSTHTTVPLGFAHGVACSIGALIALHDNTKIIGAKAVAFEVGIAGMVILVASTWALLGQSIQIENLNVLYGEAACRGDVYTCYESARARRLVMSNNSSASAWIIGLAALAFSFAVEKRFDNRRSWGRSLWEKQGTIAAFALLTAEVIAVFNYATFTGPEWHSDVVCISCVAAIFVSFTVDTFLGSLIYAISMSYEQMKLLENYGMEETFVHLTHCSLFLSLLLLWVHVTFTLIKEAITFFFELKDSSIINTVLGMTAAAGTSLCFGLYVASALLLASSNGNLPQEDDVFRGGSARRSMIAFLTCHFLPVLIWLPLLVCRCEIFVITARRRTSSWFAMVPLMAFVYVVVLRCLSRDAPTAVLMQVAGMSVVGMAGIAAWVVAAFV